MQAEKVSTMTVSHWRPLLEVGPDLLTEARLQAHFAAQGLARAARALVIPEADDSHSNLGWAGEIDGFVSHPLAPGLRLGLSLPDLSLILLDDAGMKRGEGFSLIGRTERDGGRRLKGLLESAGLDARRLDEASPYEMPEHPLAHGAAYGGERLAEALHALANWYANAQISIEKACGALAAKGFAAPPPRCWPHHFDLATLIAYPAEVDGGTAYVGAGLSPGDHYYGQPYFYVSIYPPPRSAPGRLPALGHWREKDFFAAIAEAGEIAARAAPEADSEAFLAAALDAAFAAAPRRA
jgi:hypothetical protein